MIDSSVTGGKCSARFGRSTAIVASPPLLEMLELNDIMALVAALQRLVLPLLIVSSTAGGITRALPLAPSICEMCGSVRSETNWAL